jgi:hypothetical protein
MLARALGVGGSAAMIGVLLGVAGWTPPSHAQSGNPPRATVPPPQPIPPRVGPNSDTQRIRPPEPAPSIDTNPNADRGQSFVPPRATTGSAPP